MRKNIRVRFVKDNTYGEIVGTSDEVGCVLVAFDDDWEEFGAYSINKKDLEVV